MYAYRLSFLNLTKNKWIDELNKGIVLVMKYMGYFRKKVLTAVLH